MHKFKLFLKKSFIPITIMVVPHSRTKPINIRLSLFMLASIIVLSLIGIGYVISIGVNMVEYRIMKRQLKYYNKEFASIQSTLHSLKKAEQEFTNLFSLKSKKKVLESFNIDTSDSIDTEYLKKEIEKAAGNIEEIKNFLREEKAIYISTPKGWPTRGQISSPFGMRQHPITKTTAFHSGIDIRVDPGTPIKATADGIVVYSGWSAGNGNTVVVEHGHGFTTVYAHNSKNLVHLGHRIKKGQIIAYSGTTGNTTGPHLHYEVWKNKRQINPEHFLAEE